MPRLALLGPQKLRSTLATTLDELGLDGPVVLLTAGWQENEEEDGALRRELGRPASNLALYRRAEAVFEDDRELFLLHRRRQEELRELQRLYRRRLDHALDAYRELRALAGDSPLLAAERQAALEAVSALDDHHLERVEAIHAEFEATAQRDERPALARERAAMAELLDAAPTVVIAGGHVAVLINRLRLFDLGPLLAGKTIVAWSAGAMVLAARIVLFHDSPPWGAGNAEVLDTGLALCPDLQPLPDAGRRLRLADPLRVALFARRFAPPRCVGLGEGARIWGRARAWSAERAQLLEASGAVRPIGNTGWEDLEIAS
jgi:hypothetical protein